MGARSGGFSARKYDGANYQIKLTSEGADKYRELLAASSISFDQPPASPITTPSLNAGENTSQGARQNITGSLEIYLVEDDPGQDLVQHAFENDLEVNFRLRTLGSKVGSQIALSGNLTFEVAADTGVVTITASGSGQADKDSILQSARRGRLIGIGSDFYPIQDVRYTSGAPTTIVIGISRDGRTDFPYDGSAVSAISSGNLQVYDSRNLDRIYTGLVASAPQPTATAAPDDDNLFTASISFNFNPTYERDATTPP